MSVVAIISAMQQGANTTFDVCPCVEQGVCTCAPKTDADGTVTYPEHRSFTFGPKPVGDQRSDADWQAACAGEAKAIIEQSHPIPVAQANPPVDLTALVEATVPEPPALEPPAPVTVETTDATGTAWVEDPTPTAPAAS